MKNYLLKKLYYQLFEKIVEHIDLSTVNIGNFNSMDERGMYFRTSYFDSTFRGFSFRIKTTEIGRNIHRAIKEENGKEYSIFDNEHDYITSFYPNSIEINGITLDVKDYDRNHKVDYIHDKVKILKSTKKDQDLLTKALNYSKAHE